MIKFLRFLGFLPLALCAQSHYEVFVDLHASPFMGSEVMLTLHKSLETREDGIIPPQDPPKRGIFPFLGRAMEMCLFWEPLNAFADVIQHEVFGHGYRIRSMGYARVDNYSFDFPFPYGSGGGATSWSASNYTTVGQLQAVNLAGLEAENILARNVKLKWLMDRYIEPRQASLYNNARLAPLLYSLVDATPDPDEHPCLQSHDIGAYLTTLDELYPDAAPSVKKLREQLLYNFLDPTIYYSIGAFWYYLFTGKSLGIPMIHIGDLAWLPNISVQLAPYGLEYYVENYFLYKQAPVYTYLKAGELEGMGYFGAGVHYDELFTHENFSIGVRCDTWYQPNFLVPWTVEEFLEGVRPIDTIAPSFQRQWGLSASLVSRWRIKDTLTFFYSDLGYKTKGYLPGFPLQESPIIRVGISAEF